MCGTRYQKPCILAVTTDPEEELPIFRDLSTIYMANDKVFFHVKILDTLSYDHHHDAYLLKPSVTEKCVCYDSLLSFVPLHLELFLIQMEYSLFPNTSFCYEFLKYYCAMLFNYTETMT